MCLYVCDSIIITLLDVLHDCCHLLPLGRPDLESPCWTSKRQRKGSSINQKTLNWACLIITCGNDSKYPSTLKYLCSKANKRHVDITHCN